MDGSVSVLTRQGGAPQSFVKPILGFLLAGLLAVFYIVGVSPTARADAAVPGASVGGVVFLDVDQSTYLDDGDAVLPGQEVVLRDKSNKQVASTRTGDDGRYLFDNLVPGAYSVFFSEYRDYLFFNSPDPGYQLLENASWAGSSGGTEQLVLVSGQQMLHVNGGMRDRSSVPKTGSISGWAFEDVNGNGVREATEPAVPDVLVQIKRTDLSMPMVEQRTGTDGKYFSALGQGSYEVLFTAPAGYESSFTAPSPSGKSQLIRLSRGQQLADLDAGLRKVGGPSKIFPVEISGTVFEDVNSTGKWEPGSPGLVGVKVILLDRNFNPLPGRETLTVAEGRYLFYNLPQGVYMVKFINPAGYLFTVPGSAGISSTLDLSVGSGSAGMKQVDAALVRNQPAPIGPSVNNVLGAESELANTGVAPLPFGLGAGLLVAGAGAVWFSRRRVGA
ncbi:hypothetical protein GCM10009569_23250 [Arthrobacter russicus]